MAFRESAPKRTGSTKLVALVLGLLCATAVAQDAEVELSSPTPRVGDELTINIALDPQLRGPIEVVEPEYPSVVRRIGGPIVQSVLPRPFVPTAAARQVAVVELLCVEPGYAELPAFEIVGADATVTTESHLLAVGAEGGAWWVPPTATWKTDATEVVVGQTVLVSLNLTRSADFEFPDTIDIVAPEGAVFEEVTGIGSVGEMTIAGRRFLDYPVATYLLTPTVENTLLLSPATVEIRGVTLTTQALEIPATAVPDRVSGSGAVGRFRFSAELPQQRATVGEQLTLTLTVSGEGNLSYLEFPDVEADGFMVAETTEQFDAQPTVRGYRGNRELTIRLQATEPVDTPRIRVAPFLYYDPMAGTTRAVAQKEFSVELAAADEVVTADRSLPFDLLSVEEMEEIRPKNRYLNPWFYLLLLPPVLLSLLLPSLRTSGIVSLIALAFLASATDAGSDPAEALQLYDAGDVRSAYELLSAVVSAGPEEKPGERYNLALMAYSLGRTGDAVYHLREALRLQPDFPVARETLTWLEEDLDLQNQIAPPQRAHPDRFLVVFVILAYFLGLLALLPNRLRTGLFSVAFILLVIVLLSVLAGLGISILRRSEPTVVVATSSGELRRIPEDNADAWVSLPEGTALIARDYFQEYLLVETGSEISGWIHSDQLLIDTGELQ